MRRCFLKVTRTFSKANVAFVAAPYGFLFKPSTLWPPPPAEFQERADQSTSLPGLKEAHANKVKSKPSHFSLRRANRKGEALAKNVHADSKDPHSGDPKAAERGTEKQAKGEVGKILKVKIDGEEVEVSSQIQLYATNEQVRPSRCARGEPVVLMCSSSWSTHLYRRSGSRVSDVCRHSTSCAAIRRFSATKSST